ncbi:c6 transcription factor [Lentinula edodes]|uniref:C6 transcription factor n=1 Tax=Lentinula edodes TaxID=5353 RepID=A0A1Q3EQG8_LENED|nr:c6 transcription factor [Lentinula edodes]
MANPSRSSAGRSSSAVDSPRAPLATFQTSLPSIRQLHPYLPPSGGMSQQSQHGESSHIAHPAYHPSATPQFESNAYEHAIDSENEDADTQGPPKKKRRRQALSCTECKRRKIKCDRNQPCAPCTRRGEQAKCQWHVVEPVEKYVSRAEYDELKMRFDHLENTVHRFIAANSGIIRSVGAPAAVGSAQHVTGTPIAGPDYPVPSTGYGIAGTIGNEPVPATRSPSPSSQNIATTSRFNLLTHHSNASSHSMSSRKFSIPQQPNTTSTYEFESATHHQQVQQGLLASSSTPQFSSRRLPWLYAFPDDPSRWWYTQSQQSYITISYPPK